jgi:hypothetical protein
MGLDIRDPIALELDIRDTPDISAHLPTLEQPDEATAALRDWLQA